MCTSYFALEPYLLLFDCEATICEACSERSIDNSTTPTYVIRKLGRTRNIVRCVGFILVIDEIGSYSLLPSFKETSN